jgi:hypothetical protein
MKPAQITNPFRLAGFVAANLTANGVENDSARRNKRLGLRDGVYNEREEIGITKITKKTVRGIPDDSGVQTWR